MSRLGGDEPNHFEHHLQDVGARSLRRRLAGVLALSTSQDPRSDEALLAAVGDRSLRFVALHSLINRDRDRDIRPVVNALRGQSSPAAEWSPPDAWEIIRFGIVSLTGADAADVLGDAADAQRRPTAPP